MAVYDISVHTKHCKRLTLPTEQIWDKILPGKMERFISDNTTLDHEQCLLDQRYIMDDSVSIGNYVASKGDYYPIADDAPQFEEY